MIQLNRFLYIQIVLMIGLNQEGCGCSISIFIGLYACDRVVILINNFTENMKRIGFTIIYL